MPRLQPLQLQIRNDASELRRVSDWLSRSCQAWSLPSGVLFDLDVCAQEALSNVMDHAYHDLEHHRISLQLLLVGGAVQLRVEDDGEPFNPLAKTSREAAVNLESAPIGGLGLQIIRSLMSDCSYARRDGKNVLTLRLNIPRELAGEHPR